MSAPTASPRFLALVGTVVLWASAFPAIRVGIDGLGVAALLFLRLLIAAVALLAVAPFAEGAAAATRPAADHPVRGHRHDRVPGSAQLG